MSDLPKIHRKVSSKDIGTILETYIKFQNIYELWKYRNPDNLITAAFEITLGEEYHTVTINIYDHPKED